MKSLSFSLQKNFLSLALSATRLYRISGSVCVVSSLALGMIVGPAQAREIPNAGSLLQQQESIQKQLPSPAPHAAGSSEPTAAFYDDQELVQVREIRFAIRGRVDLKAKDFSALTAPYLNRESTKGALRELATKIGETYRKAGYGFTYVVMSVDPVDKGLVIMTVIEGRAGKISLKNGTRVRDAQLESYLGRFRANPENTAAMDRGVLIMSDTPGVSAVSPSLARGTALGTVDVNLRTEPAPLINGAVSLDNYGSKTSGRIRASTQLSINSPLGLGDGLRISASGMPGSLQDGHNNVGSISYDLPIGGDGFRAGAGYSHLDYLLGGDVYNNNFDGSADVWTLYGSYPLIRQRDHSLFASIRYNNKHFVDNQFSMASTHDVESVEWGLSGNFVDTNLLFPANNHYDIELTTGQLKRSGAKPGYSKVFLSLSRRQQLGSSFFANGEIFAQRANDNLDSSEHMPLGGVSGVRAVSSDFLSVDSGVLTRLTFGYDLSNIPGLSLTTFYDMGAGALQHSPRARRGDNDVNIHGAGVGILYQFKSLYTSLSWAHRIAGSAPGLDQQSNDMVLSSITYAY